MQELFNAPFVTVSYDPDTRILFVDWKGYQSFDTATAGCERILACLEKQGASKVLNDNSNVRGLWMGAAEWAAKIWFPRMKRAGMRRFAWVYSPAKFSQISTDTALASMNPDEFGVEVFYDKDDALAWLLSED